MQGNARLVLGIQADELWFSFTALTYKELRLLMSAQEGDLLICPRLTYSVKQ